jgi:hypothetical protein
MKKVLVLIAAFAVTMAAQAAIDIDWKASAGFYFSSDSGEGILGDASGNSTVAYLVFDSDTTVGAIDPGTYGVGDSIGDGGTILSALTITSDTNPGGFDDYAFFSAVNFTDTHSAGNVYAIIFQDDSIGAGDWYWYSDAVAATDVTGAVPTQIIELNADTVLGDPIDGTPGAGFGNGQVVPEPASALLAIIGGGVAWVVRRQKLIS